MTANVDTTLPSPVWEEFSKETLSLTLPEAMVTDDIVDKANSLFNDMEASELFKENLLSYANVLAKGRYTLDQYLLAVQYSTYVMMDTGKTEAWKLTFPDRYSRLLAKGSTSKVIMAHASAYAKTKLVNLVIEQTMIKSSILNQHMFQEALNIQMDLARDAKSEMVRSTAASAVLAYTVMPDKPANQDEIVSASMSIIEQLAAATNALAQTNKEAIQGGSKTAKQVAQGSIYIDEIEVIPHG